MRNRDLQPFHWQLEFPDIFYRLDGTARPYTECGFDAVLGNPPYVSTHTSSEEAWRTINRLGLSPELRKCLATTKLIESMHSGVEGRTGRVTRRQDRDMALRWAAAAAPEAEQNCRKIIGHEDLWMLSAVLDGDRLRFPTNRRESQNPVDNGRVAA